MTRVVVVTGDPIGAKMAGPAIRAWNMALELAKENEVTLVTTTRLEPVGDAPFSLEQVQPGGAAAKAGLRNGDVVVVADGQPVLGFDQLVVEVQQHKPGDKIVVTYFRGSAKRSTTVTLDKS